MSGLTSCLAMSMGSTVLWLTPAMVAKWMKAGESEPGWPSLRSHRRAITVKARLVLVLLAAFL